MDAIKFFALKLWLYVQIFSDLESRLIRLKRLMRLCSKVGFSLEEIFFEVRIINRVQANQ